MIARLNRDLGLPAGLAVTEIEDLHGILGKRVKVRGAIVDVCEMKGCWIALASDQGFQTIRFKVDDGVIVFPMDAKGLTATVEGVVGISCREATARSPVGRHRGICRGTEVKGTKAAWLACAWRARPAVRSSWL